MDGIIGLIVIISFIIKLIDGDKKKDKKKQNQQRMQSATSWQNQRTSQSVEPWQKMLQSVKDQVSPQKERRASNDAYYYSQQQRATKERLQQKYGRQQSQQSYAKNAAKSDILSRAKGNVQEEAPNAYKQELHAAVCTEYRSHSSEAPDLKAHKGHSPECELDMDSDVMKRVNDLIVMGYSGDMKFDRDFIAEGVEMLNSFSL